MKDRHFSLSLSLDDLELRALTRIHPNVRAQEPALYATKWWDYRMLHPTLATYLFARCYEQAVRDIYAKTKDTDEASGLDVWKGEQDIFHRDLDTLAFWRARQYCDRIGVRYDFALRFAMNRSADRGWTMFPRPNQLYEETLVRDVADAWVRHLQAVFELAKSPEYDLANYMGFSHQKAYVIWLIARCATRPRPQSPLSRCFKEGQLHPKLVKRLDAFDFDVIHEAVRIAAL